MELQDPDLALKRGYNLPGGKTTKRDVQGVPEV